MRNWEAKISLNTLNTVNDKTDIEQARKLFVNTRKVDFGERLYLAIKVHIMARTPKLKIIIKYDNLIIL